MKKSITKNYIYNLIYQILVLILPLVTTPYISRVLGADGVGIYSYTLSIVTYFVLFGSLGTAMYGQREIAYVRDNKKKLSETFWEIIILRTTTMIISLIIYYFIFANGAQYQLYYKILLLELIANALDISWFLQGLEEFKRTVTRNSVVKIISTICIFTLVKTQNDLPIYILIYTLSNILGNISLLLYLPKYISKIKIKSLNLIRHIKPTIALFIPQIAIQVYTILDKTMLGNILGDMNEVGNYEQSQKIVKVALTVITSLGTVVSPRIANTAANGEKVEGYLQKSFRFVWMLGFPIMLGLISTAKTIVPWFLGQGYEISISLVMIGSLLIMAIGMNNITGIQYLVQVKKQNLFTKSVIIGAIVNFILNLIMIQIFKSKGAIITSVVAEITIFIVQLFYVRKDFNVRIVYKDSSKYIISGIVMFIITFIMGNKMNPTVTSTIIQIVIGIGIYGFSLIILKDSFVKGIMIKIKSKFIKENN